MARRWGAATYIWFRQYSYRSDHREPCSIPFYF